MGREVAFDYSKAAPFVRAEELENMKSAVMRSEEHTSELQSQR